MNRCSECGNISDFLCDCDNIPKVFCYKHLSKHSLHNGIKFVPNNHSLVKLAEVKDFFDRKKSEIENLVSECYEIKSKCIEALEKAYEKAQNTLLESYSDLSQTIDVLNSLQAYSPIPYIPVFACFFEPDLDFMQNDLIVLSNKSQQLIHDAEKLYSITSRTKDLLTFQKSPYTDYEFFHLELERIKLKEKIHKMKKNQENLSLYSNTIKSNRSKHGVLYTNFDTQVEMPDLLEAENMLALYCKRIYRISIINKDFTNDQFKKLIKIFTDYDVVKNVNIDDSISNSYQFSEFLGALPKLNCAKHVIVPRNCFLDEGIQKICLELHNFYRLCTLDLAGNLITEKGCEYICSLIPHIKCLRDFNLSDNRIGPTGAQILRPYLSSLINLEEFRISNNFLHVEGVIEIIKGTYYLKRLCILDISLNEMMDEGALFLAENLKYYTILNKLFIDSVLANEVKKILCEKAGDTCKIVCKGVDNKVCIKKRQLPD